MCVLVTMCVSEKVVLLCCLLCLQSLCVRTAGRHRVCVFVCFLCVLGEQCSQAADIIHLPVTGPRAARKVADSSPAPTTKAAS